MLTDARLMIQLAERSIHADRVVQHARFVTEASVARSEAVKAGGFSGSGYRQHVHERCAAELHRRATSFVDAICAAHKGAGSAPSDTLLVAAKDWVAVQIAREADMFGAVLWKPNKAYGEKGEPDSLIDDARREVEAASAKLDLYWTQASREHVDRTLAWATRIWRSGRRWLTLLFSR